MSKHMVVARHRAAHGSFRSYSIGFLGSIVLTYVAFGLVIYDVLSGWALALTLAVLAFVQLILQLVLFLHLGRESKPKWNLMVFGFMLLVVLIIVGGSLWIMRDLQYRHGHSHSPQETETLIIEDEGFKQ